MPQNPPTSTAPAARRSAVRRFARRVLSLLKPVTRPLRDWEAPHLHRWMMHEASRPMEPSLEPALIIAPHHDDETFGCGGTIALKRKAGVPVQIVIVTDGRQSHGHVPGADLDALARARKREALAATSILGVPPRDVHFFDLPDLGMRSLAKDSRRDVIERLAQLMRPFDGGELFVNHRYDRHPDHEATFGLVEAARQQSAVSLDVFQYPVWLIWKGPARISLRPADLRGAYRLDIQSVRDLKEQAIHTYASQLPLLPRGFVEQFQQGYEVFFR